MRWYEQKDVRSSPSLLFLFFVVATTSRLSKILSASNLIFCNGW